METGDVASGQHFSPEVLGFMQLAIYRSEATRRAEMDALDVVLLQQWQRMRFLAVEVAEKFLAF